MTPVTLYRSPMTRPESPAEASGERGGTGGDGGMARSDGPGRGVKERGRVAVGASVGGGGAGGTGGLGVTGTPGHCA